MDGNQAGPPDASQIREALREIGRNLAFSWHPEARVVFRRLDYALWRATAHNPARMLWLIPREKLEAAATDPEFLERLRDVGISFSLEPGARERVNLSVSDR